MSDEFGERLRAMREAFDSAFARPRPPPQPAGLPRVGLALGELQLALPIHRLQRAGEVPPLAASLHRRGGLLGVVGVRGALVPVYELAVLLELGPSAAAPDCALVTRGDEPVALACEGLQGIVGLRESDRLDIAALGSPPAPHLVDAYAEGKGVRWVLDVDSLLGAIDAGLEEGP